jgi:hypothetical protein
MMDFEAIKVQIIADTSLAKDALHVHIGLAIFIAVRLFTALLGWRRAGWLIAWLFALSAALGGEWLDYRAEQAGGAIVPDTEHWHDIWNTMLWPTVLLIIGPWLAPRTRKPRALDAVEADASSEDVEQPFEQA